MPIDVERGLATGFLRYLMKPVNLPPLEEMLEQVTAGPA
jgi:response regulator of citrate/malate metabolism